jgi:uncharacterized protein
MIAIDTNLLVYAHRSATPESNAAKAAIEEAANSPMGFGISFPCLGEFWSVVTHPSCTGRPSTPEEASNFVRMLVNEAGAKIWYPGEGFGERCFEAATVLDVMGARYFDLQIGLIALENGADVIWTHDRNFLKLPKLKNKDPIG